MKVFKSLLLFAVAISFIGCGASQRAASIITNARYEEKTNTTEYMYLPYGQVSIPGKWEKASFAEDSRQQFFHNDDSVTIAVSFAPCNKFGFNTKGTLKGFDFLEAYYEWESEYFVSNELECKALESNKAGNYLIYRVFGQGYDTYILISEKNAVVSNYSVMATDKWTEKQKIDFLKSLL